MTSVLVHPQYRLDVCADHATPAALRALATYVHVVHIVGSPDVVVLSGACGPREYGNPVARWRWRRT